MIRSRRWRIWIMMWLWRSSISDSFMYGGRFILRTTNDPLLLYPPKGRCICVEIFPDQTIEVRQKIRYHPLFSTMLTRYGRLNDVSDKNPPQSDEPSESAIQINNSLQVQYSLQYQMILMTTYSILGLKIPSVPLYEETNRRHEQLLQVSWLDSRTLYITRQQFYYLLDLQVIPMDEEAGIESRYDNFLFFQMLSFIVGFWLQHLVQFMN